jgi:tetratricopeptide (TPR) repeat protein
MPELRIEFHPVYLEELRPRHSHLEAVVAETIQETAQSLLPALSQESGVERVLERHLPRLEDPDVQLRAHVICEILRSELALHESCRAVCRRLAQVALSDGGRYQLAKCYSELGVAARQAGDHATALGDLKQGLRILGRLPVRVVTANLYYSLGIAYERQADIRAARDAFRRCARIEKKLGRKKEAEQAKQRVKALKPFIRMTLEQLAIAFSNQGVESRRQGDMMGALTAYELALKAAQRADRPDLQAKICHNLASVYFNQGDSERACAILETAIEELAPQAGPGLLVELETSLASSYSQRQQWSEAARHFERAHRLADELGDRAAQGNCLHGQGEMLIRQGRLDEARRFLEQARAIREEIGEPVRLANTLNELAVIAYRQGDPPTAEPLLRRSLRLRIDAGDRRGIAESLGSLSDVLDAAEGEPRQALAFCLRAARLADRIRQRVGTGEASRIAFMEKVSRYYQQATRLACQLGRPLPGFWAFQRVQNRALIEYVATADVPRPSTLPSALFDEEQSLFRRLRRNRDKPHQVSETLSLLQSFYAGETMHHAPVYSRWRMGWPIRRGELEGHLAAAGRGAAYLEIAEWDKVLYGALAGGPAAKPLTVFAVQLSSDDRPPTMIDRIGFYKDRVEETLAPFLRQILGGPGPLLLVPHGLLARLPLHALAVDDEPIVAGQAVRYLPHAAILQRRLFQARPTSVDDLVVIGDPGDNLPGARREAQRLGERHRARVVLGKHATRDAILAALKGADVLHFAGHAYFDPQEPKRSGLLASDGVLTAEDVLMHEIRTSVVVLNACESGVTGVGLGMELEGFIRSLLMAGVDHLVCTLWRVDDLAAEYFGERFYQALGTERDVVRATREAQLALWGSHPESLERWAPFIQVG